MKTDALKEAAIVDTAMSACATGVFTINEVLVTDGYTVVVDMVDIASFSAAYQVLAQVGQSATETGGDSASEEAVSGETVSAEPMSTESVTEDLVVVEALTDSRAPDSPVGSEPAPEPAMLVSLNRLILAGESLSFEDQTVDPPVKLALLSPELDVTGIAPGQAGELSFNAIHGKDHQTLTVTGTIEPSVPDLNMDIVLNDFDLFTLGGYSDDRIRSGQFSIESGIRLSDDALKSENQRNVPGLIMSEEGSGDAMPIAAALSLLKDKDGNIDLEVPVEDRLDELSVDVNGILGKALSNAATRTAVTYAKFALQPFGGILRAKDLASGLKNPSAGHSVCRRPASVGN